MDNLPSGRRRASRRHSRAKFGVGRIAYAGSAFTGSRMFTKGVSTVLFDVRKAVVSHFEGITTGLAGCISLTLPWCPSVNHVWKQTGRRVVLDPKVEAFRRKVAVKVKTLRTKNIIPFKTICSDCIVMTEFMPPDKRRRDLDNYNKSLWDALTHAGVWKDDSQVKILLSFFGRTVKGGAVNVLIQPLEV